MKISPWLLSVAPGSCLISASSMLPWGRLKASALKTKVSPFITILILVLFTTTSSNVCSLSSMRLRWMGMSSRAMLLCLPLKSSSWLM